MKEIKQGRFECPVCHSSDSLAYLSDGTYCHSANHPEDTYPRFTPYPDGTPQVDETVVNHKPTAKAEMLDTSQLQPLPIKSRGITAETCEFYGVLTKLNPTTGQPGANLFPIDTAKETIGHKIRILPKEFRFSPAGVGSNKNALLFGQKLFPPGCAKAITITEGFEDALAGFQMFGNKYPFLSIIGGASQAKGEIQRNLEYLESFEKVYFCFDRDDPGQEAAIACAKLLSPGKAHVMAMDPKLKDACGYLKAGEIQAFTKAWWNSPLYTPAGILTSSQLKERIRNRDLTSGIPYPFPGLNDLTYGIRKKEAVIVTAPTGVGKTTFLRETMWNILQEDPNARIGTIFLEESPEDSGLGLLSMAASIPFHLPDATYTQEDYDAAERILDEDRVFFFDHFGSNKIDEILTRVRYYKQGLGCDYIFLDHLSIIVSDQQQGDERKALDEIMTKLKTLTMELDIALIAVVHTNRNGQIRGTAGIEQLANIIIELDRDVKNPDAEVRRTLTALVAKNRFSGKTGPAFAAAYNENTGRLDDRMSEGEQISSEDLTKFFGDDTLELEGVGYVSSEN